MPRILIADDHDLVRDTIAAYLETVDGFTVRTASDFDGALADMRGLDVVDLVILDYNMPGMNGLDGLDRARKAHPTSKVVLMSGVANKDVANAAMAQGADGFIPKRLAAKSMVNAIKFVLAGERYFPADFAEAEQPAMPSGKFRDLSDRELQTLEQLCSGLSNKEIARHLGVQEVTVKLHVKNVLAKLNVSNRTQAALLAKEHHLF
ncbi:response regulator transcription factor [Tateyamaria sp. ANG-S1]|uniref:response regulator n=1 Tax=Tateyamaria sp. ANG-S1 TaxID=1577905 RepID=UPI00057E982D|nr:response regulator transcription factor [Tateyamaria sp. ANG-S1]KIC50390.1 chemotaxis protein CheY [Tateyamaria sp. ANG-S1]